MGDKYWEIKKKIKIVINIYNMFHKMPRCNYHKFVFSLYPTIPIYYITVTMFPTIHTYSLEKAAEYPLHILCNHSWDKKIPVIKYFMLV